MVGENVENWKVGWWCVVVRRCAVCGDTDHRPAGGVGFLHRRCDLNS